MIKIDLGFTSILALVLITLKLTNYISWSWIWVLGPVWIPTVAIVTLIIISAMIDFHWNNR
jgi:hypothetical protein